jgi:geranylgeranyl transferase type-1 subunit beta
MAALQSSTPELRKDKQITYFLRCLKTYLPWQYTSADSNRLMLAYFVISGLDLLGALETSTTAEERLGYADWVYRCQHPNGGFRGFPGTDFGDLSTPENAVWDPANIPATCFALLILLILRDDMKRVKRIECLQWLKKMQRPDGSFGQTLGLHYSIEGGFDTRFGYVAMLVRWIIRILSVEDMTQLPDVDTKRLVQNISRRQVCSQNPVHSYIVLC